MHFKISTMKKRFKTVLDGPVPYRFDTSCDQTLIGDSIAIPTEIWNIILIHIPLINQSGMWIKENMQYQFVSKQFFGHLWNRFSEFDLTIDNYAIFPYFSKYIMNLERLSISNHKFNQESKLLLKSIFNIDLISNFESWLHLRELDLSKCGTSVDCAIINGMKGLVNLEILNLNRCSNVDDTCLKIIAKEFPLLRNLKLNNSVITSLGIRKLKKLIYLEELNIRGCSSLMSDSLRFIGNISMLKILNISTCPFLYDDGGLKYLEKLENLQVLYMDGTLVDNPILWRPIENLTTLKRLSLHCSFSVTAVHMNYIAKLVNLVDLNLSYCFHLNDLALVKLATLTKLKHLNLSGCPINGMVFEAFSENFSELEVLHLKQTTIKHQNYELLSGFYNLVALNFDGSDIDFSSLNYLLSYCIKLEAVSVKNCMHLTQNDVDQCKEIYPNINFSFVNFVSWTHVY
eukprot:TRINITY_DN10592_c0_g1_i1.p1 TRINITY_DN10592_c0_g1~~TRINITY_DN10592_c0_g1_i1.p1  ORF type:complete len:458 (-),score=53.99 TRINITY_DN10592_c0_g1_i1:422-1795(-)